MTKKRWRTLAACGLLWLGGCATGFGDEAGGGEIECTGSCDEGGGEPAPGGAATVIRGADVEWLRCWVIPGPGPVDDFNRYDTFSCQLAASTTPLRLLNVAVRTLAADGSLNESVLTEPGRAHTIGGLHGPDYPVEVKVIAQLSDINAAIKQSGLRGAFEAKFTIAGRGALPTEATPAILRQPFDLWPVTISVQTSLFNATTAASTIDLGPTGYTSAGSTTLSGVSTRIESVQQGGTASLVLPVTSGATGAISGQGLFHRSTIAFSIPGPGAYVATDSGLSPAQ